MLRSLLLVAISVLGKAAAAQTVYSWTPGVNPGWTSVNTGSGSPLIWQSACHVVSTQCNGNYDGNQNTSYTSNTINTTYMYANSVQISYNIIGNTESNDTLYASYSLNGGTTWQHAQIHAGSNYNTLSSIIFNIPTSNNLSFALNSFLTMETIKPDMHCQILKLSTMLRCQLSCHLFPVKMKGTKMFCIGKHKANTTIIILKSVNQRVEQIGVYWPK